MRRDEARVRRGESEARVRGGPAPAPNQQHLALEIFLRATFGQRELAALGDGHLEHVVVGAPGQVRGPG